MQRVDFFITGVRKCGTTALVRFLDEHSQIQMSRRKETHFFDKDHGFDWRAPDCLRLHRFLDWSVDGV